MNAITKHEGGALALAESEMLDVLGSSHYPGANPHSIKLVLGYCKAAGLDPMLKPVHIVPMWDKESRCMRDVVMPGIGLYRMQASRSGECAGTTEPEFGPDITEKIGGQDITYPQWCRVTVKRRLSDGTIAEFTAREFWKENYAIKGGKDRSIAPNAMWSKRPYGQLGKCAEAQALRKAFPEFGSQPTAEEMEGKSMDIDMPAAPPARPGLEPYPQESFDKNIAQWLALINSGKRSADDIIAAVSSKAILSDEQKALIRGDVEDAEFIEEEEQTEGSEE